jgi:hypothetical protein
LLPVKSNNEGIACYVGKYISKNVRERLLADKGARLVRHIGFKPGDRTARTKFGWNTENAWLWRHKLKAFALRKGFTNTDEIAKIYGPRWCYHLQEEILRERVNETFPSERGMYRSRAMEKLEFNIKFEEQLRFVLPSWERFPPSSQL